MYNLGKRPYLACVAAVTDKPFSPDKLFCIILIRTAVRSDIHNQFIPAEHLKTEEYLEKIKDWTTKQKMILNQKKTNVMIFNFKYKYKFTTNINLNNENIRILRL